MQKGLVTPMTKIFTLVALVLALVGCGGGQSPVPGLLAPRVLNAGDYRAPGIPAQFGDTDPHGWTGLTPAHYAVHGIDVARYNRLIDFGAARAAGVQFAWLKATEGGDLLDPGFGLNVLRARDAGVAVGAYHFYYPCRDIAEQARWFIANVPRIPGDLPPVLDMEWNNDSPTCRLRPPPSQIRADIEVFAQMVTAHYDTAPVVYVAPDFYQDNDLGALANVEFWLRAVTDHPSTRYPGEHWSFWQYSGTGVVPGVPGESDLNAFAGDAAAWELWLATRRQR